jgi:hypothetical protein
MGTRSVPSPGALISSALKSPIAFSGVVEWLLVSR